MGAGSPQRDGFEDVSDAKRSEEVLEVGGAAQGVASGILLVVAHLPIEGCVLEQAVGDAGGHPPAVGVDLDVCAWS